MPNKKPEGIASSVGLQLLHASRVVNHGKLQGPISDLRRERGDRSPSGASLVLLNVIDRNIVNGLEAPRGVAEFRKLWEIDSKSDRLLRDLSTALNLGSAWHQQDKQNKATRVLCAPYVPIKWPLDDVDPYDSGAIVVKEALIKDRPSHAAATLGTLSSFRWIESRMPTEFYAQFRVQFRRADAMPEKALRDLVKQYGFSVANLNYVLTKDGERFEYRMVLRTLDQSNTPKLADHLGKEPAVVEFRIAPIGS